MKNAQRKRDGFETTPFFEAAWYLRRYPDSARLPLTAAQHFKRIGGPLLRSPGPQFSSRYYLDQNPDVAAAGIPPLDHYIKAGLQEGRQPHPPAMGDIELTTLSRVLQLRNLLETGGLDDGPLETLQEIARQAHSPASALAKEVLAFWALRQGDKAKALDWFAQRLGAAPPQSLLARLAPVMRLGLGHAAGDKTLAMAPETVDLHLAAMSVAGTVENSAQHLNRALMLGGLAPLSLSDHSGPGLDRLQGDPGIPAKKEGSAPLVSVILAAFQAEATINTAVSSILSQSWRNLELIVVDDASPDRTASIVAQVAKRDPRVKLINLPQNAGAYQARNIALEHVQGQHITLQDADDYSHPERLEKQMEFLRQHSGHAGCMGVQARCHEDLGITRWTGEGYLTFDALPSLILPADLFRNCLGHWDTVRAGADSELLRRIRKLFGDGSVSRIPQTAPILLQRDHRASATADKATGMDWFYYGARREYYEAQQFHHRHSDQLFYDGINRAFPAPAVLQRSTEIVLDHVYAGIMTACDAATDRLLNWLKADSESGHTAGLVPLYSSMMPMGGMALHPRIRAMIDGQNIRVLCHGETVSCGVYHRLSGQRIDEEHRYLPHVRTIDGLCVLAPGMIPAP